MRIPALRGWTAKRLAIPAAAALVVTAIAAGVVAASDHQDTPFVEFNPRYDINDVYAFPGSAPGRIALVLGTQSPITPANTPAARFGDVSEELYQLKVDNNGDGVEDLVFQITFTGGRDGAQKVTLVGPVRPNETGTANTLVQNASRTITGRVGQVLGSPTGVQLFTGPRDDPFFIDLEAFFSVLPDRRPAAGPLSQITQGPLTFRPPGQAVDFVRGLNDMAIVIELPASMLGGDGHHTRFGIWGTTSKMRSAGTL